MVQPARLGTSSAADVHTAAAAATSAAVAQPVTFGVAESFGHRDALVARSLELHRAETSKQQQVVDDLQSAGCDERS